MRRLARATAIRTTSLTLALGLACWTGCVCGDSEQPVRIAQTDDATEGPDWPQWRGPYRDGTTRADLSDPWPETLKQVWSVEVGEGHSGPVIADANVVVFCRQGNAETTLCLNPADGERRWRETYEAHRQQD